MNRTALFVLVPVASALLALAVTVAGLFAKESGLARTICAGPALLYMHWMKYDVAGPPEGAFFGLIVNFAFYMLLFTALGTAAMVIVIRRRRTLSGG